MLHGASMAPKTVAVAAILLSFASRVCIKLGRSPGGEGRIQAKRFVEKKKETVAFD